MLHLIGIDNHMFVSNTLKRKGVEPRRTNCFFSPFLKSDSTQNHSHKRTTEAKQSVKFFNWKASTEKI